VHRKQPWSYPGAGYQVAAAVRRTNPDVVHLHSFVAGAFGRISRRVVPPGVGVVYQPHAWNFTAARSAGSLRAVTTWERWAGERTHVVVVNCEEEAQEGRSRGIHAEAVVVSFPVDPQVFVPADSEARSERADGLGLGSRHVVLCLGALCWQKGQDRLVAAWEKDPPPDSVLVLAGGSGGPYLRRHSVELIRQLAPREWNRSIVAVGHQVDVAPWLQAADVLVQPSRYESMGVAVAEALCAGVPVVTFDVTGAREAILDGPEEDVAGAVAAQGDVRGLMTQLSRRLEDPALLEAERAAARRRGLRLFRPDQAFERLAAAHELAASLAQSASHG
jgi:glycosyltransferase involved in cell wall biosynthesis